MRVTTSLAKAQQKNKNVGIVLADSPRAEELVELNLGSRLEVLVKQPLVFGENNVF